MKHATNIVYMKKKIEPLVIDNFLDKQSFQVLQKIMLGYDFGWFYNNQIDYSDDVNKFQFIHLFYQDNIGINSDSYLILNTIIDKLKPKEIIRIKANLLTRTLDVAVNNFHVDVDLDSIKDLPLKTNVKTAIFYINTNNGYTEFEDGSTVKSIENRMVIFPSEISHRGTSCTDQNTRVVINFNYLQDYIGQ